MNELAILGELMESPHSGYSLRKVLHNTLNRTISYGTLYPMLSKLEEKGYITTQTDPEKTNRNISTITAAGREYFYQLMREPIANNAHSAEMYAIKLDVMQHLPLNEQLDLLVAYAQTQTDLIETANHDRAELEQKQSRDHLYASRIQDLRIKRATAALDWAAEFTEALRKEPLNDSRD